MKKLFTLLAATFCIGSVFAQYDHTNGQRRNEDQVYQNQEFRNSQNDFQGNYNDNYRFKDHGDDRMMVRRVVDRINWKFDSKIAGVQHSWYMRPWEKNRVINNLEAQRRYEIRMAYSRFGGRGYNNGYDDRN